MSTYICNNGETQCINLDDVFRWDLCKTILAITKRREDYDCREMLKEYLAGIRDIHIQEGFSGATCLHTDNIEFTINYRCPLRYPGMMLFDEFVEDIGRIMTK